MSEFRYLTNEGLLGRFIFDETCFMFTFHYSRHGTYILDSKTKVNLLNSVKDDLEFFILRSCSGVVKSNMIDTNSDSIHRCYFIEPTFIFSDNVAQYSQSVIIKCKTKKDLVKLKLIL